MTKKGHRKPAAFRVEEVELFLPPVAPEVSAEATALPARVRTLPDLSRGLRWGSILVGALGGLIGLLASIWLYDYVLALLARDDWIGWLAVGLIALVVFALLMIILREAAGLARLDARRWRALAPAVARGEEGRLAATLHAWLADRELPRPPL